MAGKQILQGTGYGKNILAVLVLIIIPSYIYSQQPDLKFEHLSVDLEAGDPTVNRITQDRKGYLWFSCDNLIIRHDGYNFITYSHDSEDTLSSEVSFTVPYEDKEGNFWIGTTSGLEKLDRWTGSFMRYMPDSSDIENKNSNSVLSLCEDKNGMLWVGTKNGLYKFDRYAGEFIRLVHDSTDPGSIYNNEIREIYEDAEGDLWFGTAGGLDRYDFKTEEFIHYWSEPEEKENDFTNTSKYKINDIRRDKNGTLWIATNWGIVEFNRTSGSFNNYLPNPDYSANLIARRITSINVNYIFEICPGPTGIIWVGTYTGLYGFDKKSKKFKYQFIHDPKNPESISHNKVVSLYSEPSGTIWAGSKSGLNKFNPAKKISKINYPEGYYNYMLELNNELYVKTSKGWYCYDQITGKYFPHSFGKDKFYGRGKEGISWYRDKKGNSYLTDRQGNIGYMHTRTGKKFNIPPSCSFAGTKGLWIGTFYNQGVYLLDTTLIISKFKNIQGSIDFIYEDSYHLVWIARLSGNLLCYDQERDTLKEFISDPNIPGSISGPIVTMITEDKNNRLWFSTNKGLDRFDHLTGKFILYPEKEEISDKYLVNVLEDDNGFLWLSKQKGIIKFDPDNNLFYYFSIPENTKIIWGGSTLRAFKSANGSMYISCSNGIIHFHPNNLKINSFMPPVVITSFRKFDIPYPVKREIHLPYDENFLSFEFAALSYIRPEKNQYAYMMEGLDKDWIYSGHRRYASYTNLNPGKYIFKVKGSNNDGVWNEEGTSVLIFISPPWWKTVWSYIAYSVVLLYIIYLTWRLQVKRLRMRHEYAMSRFEAEKLHELDELKSRFFANISHEFRTPLTLILGPVNLIKDKIKDQKIRNQLMVVNRNAARLLELVNQLLDISKLESGSMKLRTSPHNIIPLLKALVFSFSSYAERKRMTLKFNSADEEITAYIDKDKFEKIINNILSNAFKYTPEGGEIEVKVKRAGGNDIPPSPAEEDKKDQKKLSPDKYIMISVNDTGIGIAVEQLPKLFDRFYQVDGSRIREYEGTGIGLALTKELIELHKGRINVTSISGKGTTFSIYLPLGKEHLKSEEIIETKDAERNYSYPASQGIYSDETKSKSGRDLIQEKDKQILLIVEDNTEVRNYIKDNLKEDYSIHQAADGKKGLKITLDCIPDLIISDVMMPEMDGFELCKRIKEDERTSHIPIIMLTAKAGDEDKIEGYETGADDYIMKPFDMKELKARIRNLIEQRNRLHEHFRKHGLIELEMSDITSTDKTYLQKTFDTINKNISDSSFGIEALSESLGTSRSVLHRKISSLTGESPGELIRQIRLQKASQLIEQNFGNISEISLEVGFSNPSQFTRSFRKQFGVSPSEYQKNQKNK